MNDPLLARLLLEGRNCFNCYHMFDCKDLEGEHYVCVKYKEYVEISFDDMAKALISLRRIDDSSQK